MHYQISTTANRSVFAEKRQLMKDKNAAGILALLLGGFGIHQFYLGKNVKGFLHLIFFWTPFSWIIGLVSAIIYFTMSQEKFDAKYNNRPMDEMPDFRRRYMETETLNRNRERWREHREKPAYERKVIENRRDNPYRASGIKKFKDYDYQGAIEDFAKSLEINERDPAIHFNIACAYSLCENAESAFRHIERAVALGFTDFKRIKEHDALAYLRIQDEFDTFERNGFKQIAPKQAETTENDLLNSQPDLLDQLNKLSELKELGLLTEEEFVDKKKKLFG